MNIIIIFLSIITINAHAQIVCRLSEENQDGSMYNPKLAKTIVVGKIEEKDSKMFFISIKPWDPLRIELSLKPCVGFRTQRSGEVLLLTSEQSSKELEKKVVTLYDVNAAFLNEIQNMTRDLSELSEELPKGHANVFWKYCSHDSECTTIRNSCGDKTGSSIRYKDKFEKFLIDHKIDCKNNKKTKDSASKCIQSFCS